MLLTVTPNLCIERTIEFAEGQVHRVEPESLTVNAGGKGINAARVAARLGCASLATAWVGRRQKQWFEEQLQSEGIAHDLVEVKADTRVCVNVIAGGAIAGSGWTKTEIVEAGNALAVEDGTRMLEKFVALLPQADLVAICGSYPPSAHAAFDSHLALLTQVAGRAGKRVLVDGKGRAFEIALRSKTPPWAIKPNAEEAAALLRREIRTPAHERRAVRDLLRLDVEVVILSCGARGAYLGTREGVWFFRPPRIIEVSPVGSGDALVGAFCAKLLECGDLKTAMRWGVAAGTANATQSASAFCSASDIEPLLEQVKMEIAELRLTT
jgi:1-phosphofructokinase family hexose kinase